MKKIILVVLGIVACGAMLKLQDNYERKNAITRCGSEDKIVEAYTAQGDKYFTCTIEK